jgi:hypothetical protein
MIIEIVTSVIAVAPNRLMINGMKSFIVPVLLEYGKKGGLQKQVVWLASVEETSALFDQARSPIPFYCFLLDSLFLLPDVIHV